MLTYIPEQLQDRLVNLRNSAIEFFLDTSLDPLLKRIVAAARQQAGAGSAVLVTFNESGELQKILSSGITEIKLSQLEKHKVWQTILNLLRSREPVLITDMLSIPQLGEYLPGELFFKSFLGVPIWHNDQQFGFVLVADKADGAYFQADDQKVLETLVSYAAAAIFRILELQHLQQENDVLNRKNKNIGMLNEMATGLASSMDIDQIFEKTIIQVMDSLNLEAGEVFLRLEDSRTLKLVWHHAKPEVERMWTQNRYKFGEGVIGRAAQIGHPAVYKFSEVSDNSLALNELPCFEQLICFPLTGMRGVWGVFCAATCSPEAMDELSLRFLSLVSMWLGTTIENIRYNLQQRRNAVLEERERIGMDLHDGVIQSIYAVGLTLEHARLLMKENPQAANQRIEQAINDLNTTIRDIRSYILGLRPRQLYNENLMKGIQRLIGEFRINTLVDVNLKGTWEDLVDMPETQAVALFHICQEALANISKHAHAHQVNVLLRTTTDRAYLEISDNGKGFNTGAVKLNLGHGLMNMQTRAYNAGGDVEFVSKSGEGTTIIAWVPFVNEKFTYE
jgi:two-component system, NarL family, sensor histidine kinase DevS